jgi:hypothetical protein
MPKVPSSSLPRNVGSGTGESPLTSVNPENLLMAAAAMHSQGRFSTPSAKDTHPNPLPKRPIRKLKVVK